MISKRFFLIKVSISSFSSTNLLNVKSSLLESSIFSKEHRYNDDLF